MTGDIFGASTLQNFLDAAARERARLSSRLDYPNSATITLSEHRSADAWAASVEAHLGTEAQLDDLTAKDAADAELEAADEATVTSVLSNFGVTFSDFEAALKRLSITELGGRGYPISKDTP